MHSPIKMRRVKMEFDRVILIVLDGVGIGELPDAADYNDCGSNTVGNISKMYGRPKIPNMCKLGFSMIEGVDYLDIPVFVNGCFGRMKETSKGKDTITGHWEIAGVFIKEPFPVYPSGFPNEVIEEFIKRTGTDILGNYKASGTEIIKTLGQRHVETGYPIIYTSADSVFQIAAHEEVISLDSLYEMCKIARNILREPHGVGRVVARPFIGEYPNYIRTKNRRDFCLEPISKTILEGIKEKGFPVIGIGKIEDIFSGKGITDAVHTEGNIHGMDIILQYMEECVQGLLFVNLVDFDMLYGHRNDAYGYKKALEEFDQWLGDLLTVLNDNDLLIITSDHGCDPTTPSTDHSREYVPLLVYGKSIKAGVNLGTRSTFSDIASTLADIFNISHSFEGKSFLNLISI